MTSNAFVSEALQAAPNQGKHGQRKLCPDQKQTVAKEVFCWQKAQPACLEFLSTLINGRP
jgi:hypothetical protein